MPLIDDRGRVLAVVNIIDLLAVLLAVAMLAAVSALFLPRAVAGPLTAVVGVGAFVGLVAVSKWRFDLTGSEVRTALRDARPSWPSRPYFRGLWNWLIAEPEPEVIVIDLRETVTMGPVIVLLDWVVAWLSRRYQGSLIERIVIVVAAGTSVLINRTGLRRVARIVNRALAPPEPPDSE